MIWCSWIEMHFLIVNEGPNRQFEGGTHTLNVTVVSLWRDLADLILDFIWITTLYLTWREMKHRIRNMGGRLGASRPWSSELFLVAGELILLIILMMTVMVASVIMWGGQWQVSSPSVIGTPVCQSVLAMVWGNTLSSSITDLSGQTWDLIMLVTDISDSLTPSRPSGTLDSSKHVSGLIKQQT